MIQAIGSNGTGKSRYVPNPPEEWWRRLRLAAAIISAPAVTSASLLARAMVRPASTAPHRLQTGAATIAAITQSASPGRRFGERVGSAAEAGRAARQESLEIKQAIGIVDYRQLAFVRRAASASAST